MMNKKLLLFCLDVDGTLLTEEMKGMGQYVEGIIPTQILIALENMGHIIAIVSPSPFLPRRYANSSHWFKRNGDNTYRFENIMDARNYHQMPLSHTIYVDDLEANRKSVATRYVSESFSPEKFLEMYQWNHHL